MGFFNNLFGNSKTETPKEEKRDLTIEQLFKDTSQDLEKHVVNLSKEKGVNLNNHIAQFFSVFDRSASMYIPFDSGQMQRVSTKFFTIGVKFDNDKEMQVLVFNAHTNQVESMTLENYTDFVQSQIINKGFGPSGTTGYVPAIDAIIDMYANSKCPCPYPAFGTFLTDGAADESSEKLDAAFKRLYETHKIFLACIGFRTYSTRDTDFDYLKELNKRFPNINFMEVDDFERMGNDQLFSGILKGYPEWLRRNNYI